jgi:anti-sigma regulatory factor (Ser/Thr protein kinase)
MGRGKWSYGSSAEWLASSGPMSWRRTYPGRADQAAVARRFAASLLAGTGRGEEVEFIVSELVSNALRYTRSGEKGGWFALEVALTELAYVAVTDLGGGGRPAVQLEPTLGEPCEGGWGLLGVSKLAVAIGIHGNPQVGHTVWADLAPVADEGEPQPDLVTRLGM